MITRARLAAFAAALALSAGAAADAHAHQAHSGTVGAHGPAGVTCYSDGTVTVAPNLDKIGYAPQSLGYRIWFRDRRSGEWSVTGWRTFHSPYGGLVTVGKDWFRMRPSNYDVVLDYAWNLGAGWSTDTTWTPAYTIGGDFFGYPASTCRAMATTTTVSGCADFGGVVSCPRSLRGRKRTAGARRTRALPAKRHVVRAPRAMPR
jgi:hypothetical protein